MPDTHYLSCLQQCMLACYFAHTLALSLALTALRMLPRSLARPTICISLAVVSHLSNPPGRGIPRPSIKAGTTSASRPDPDQISPGLRCLSARPGVSGYGHSVLVKVFLDSRRVSPASWYQSWSRCFSTPAGCLRRPDTSPDRGVSRSTGCLRFSCTRPRQYVSWFTGYLRFPVPVWVMVLPDSTGCLRRNRAVLTPNPVDSAFPLGSVFLCPSRVPIRLSRPRIGKLRVSCRPEPAIDRLYPLSAHPLDIACMRRTCRLLLLLTRLSVTYSLHTLTAHNYIDIHTHTHTHTHAQQCKYSWHNKYT